MIIGLGTDIVHIDRIEKLITEFGDRFINRSYTTNEIKGADRFGANNNIGRASYYARRFAAKEAFAKALGTGFRNGLRFQQIGIVNDKLGKPCFELTDKAHELLNNLNKPNHHITTHISLCDDYPIAQATVIIALEIK